MNRSESIILPEVEPSHHNALSVGFSLDNLPGKFRRKLEDEESPLLRLPHELAFPEGIALVVGPNGAGKTTFLLGLSYALFPEQAAGAEDTTNLRHVQARAFAESLSVPDDRITLNLESGVEAHKRQNSHLSQRQGIDRQLHHLLSSYERELNVLSEGNEDIVLFIDEPEVGMDPRRQKNILEELKVFAPYAPLVIVATNSPYLFDSDLPRLDLDQPEKGVFYPKDELNKRLMKGVCEGLYDY